MNRIGHVRKNVSGRCAFRFVITRSISKEEINDHSWRCQEFLADAAGYDFYRRYDATVGSGKWDHFLN